MILAAIQQPRQAVLLLFASMCCVWLLFSAFSFSLVPSCLWDFWLQKCLYSGRPWSQTWRRWLQKMIICGYTEKKINKLAEWLNRAARILLIFFYFALQCFVFRFPADIRAFQLCLLYIFHIYTLFLGFLFPFITSCQLCSLWDLTSQEWNLHRNILLCIKKSPL